MAEHSQTENKLPVITTRCLTQIAEQTVGPVCTVYLNIASAVLCSDQIVIKEQTPHQENIFKSCFIVSLRILEVSGTFGNIV